MKYTVIIGKKVVGTNIVCEDLVLENVAVLDAVTLFELALKYADSGLGMTLLAQEEAAE